MQGVTKYQQVIVCLGEDVTRWCDLVVRSLVRAGVDYQQIDLLRCQVAELLVSSTADQPIDQRLFCLFKQWVTVKDKRK